MNHHKFCLKLHHYGVRENCLKCTRLSMEECSTWFSTAVHHIKQTYYLGCPKEQEEESKSTALVPKKKPSKMPKKTESKFLSGVCKAHPIICIKCLEPYWHHQQRFAHSTGDGTKKSSQICQFWVVLRIQSHTDDGWPKLEISWTYP